MTEDLIYVSILSTICLIIILLYYKINKKNATINLILFLIYNVYFYNGLFTWTQGTALGALLGLLLFAPIHILVLIIFMIKNFVEKKKNKNSFFAKTLKWWIAILLLLLIVFVVGFSILFFG